MSSLFEQPAPEVPLGLGIGVVCAELRMDQDQFALLVPDQTRRQG